MNVIFDKQKQRLPIFNWASQINDEQTYEQLIELSNHPAAFHHIAAMPDAHAGYGMNIGGVAAFINAVLPYCVGNDISCGMIAVKTSLKTHELNTDNLSKIFNNIKRYIPVGCARNRNNVIEYVSSDIINSIKNNLEVPESVIAAGVDNDSVISQCGTLGSGNHFIEFQKDKDDNLWIMIHSGSRNIGAKVCTYYWELAKELNTKYHSTIPNDKLAFLVADSNEGKLYIDAMEYCIKFSEINKKTMIFKIFDVINSIIDNETLSIAEYSISHNFARLENHYDKNVWVHRKGATPAFNNYGIIPGSMGSYSYIVKGKNNKKSFCSCSHGAGRAMSRKASREQITIENFRKSMNGILYDKRQGLIDESPAAYKDISIVMHDQIDLVDIVTELTPIMSIKG